MIRLILAASLAVAVGGTATAQQGDRHIIVKPDAIKWGPAPPALPPGAKGALLYGDPAKPGLFVLRLWVPKGYRLAPHVHARPEVVTVMSGSSMLGYGRVADRGKAQRLPAGSFMVTPANAPHYAFFDEDTVLQLSTTGPWSLTYVNPADDPRKKAR
jgi:quercetin dioxygenase-like cupin family protein